MRAPAAIHRRIAVWRVATCAWRRLSALRSSPTRARRRPLSPSSIPAALRVCISISSQLHAADCLRSHTADSDDEPLAAKTQPKVSCRAWQILHHIFRRRLGGSAELGAQRILRGLPHDEILDLTCTRPLLPACRARARSALRMTIARMTCRWCASPPPPCPSPNIFAVCPPYRLLHRRHLLLLHINKEKRTHPIDQSHKGPGPASRSRASPPKVGNRTNLQVNLPKAKRMRRQRPVVPGLD